ncbi:MAG TPA: hypothetical protein DCQ64_13720 [Candidatus Rokubacteria bacterium]|nr:hypothetical protein [Candidatus Rokubacteria bacterium]
MEAVLGQLLSTLLGSLLMQGSTGKVDKLINSQSRLADTASNIFGRQAAQDLPFRGAVYSGLLNRSRQQFPRIMPTQPGAALNPMADGRRPSYPTGGVSGMPGQPGARPDFNSLLQALMARR